MGIYGSCNTKDFEIVGVVEDQQPGGTLKMLMFEHLKQSLILAKNDLMYKT